MTQVVTGSLSEVGFSQETNENHLVGKNSFSTYLEFLFSKKKL